MSAPMGGSALLWITLLLFSPDGMSADWLLIQSTTDVLLEGESFFIRCHGWMNRNVYKVIYYKNGKAIKYWYENHNISITNATIEDSGTYYCGGILWQINYTSDPIEITVKKGSTIPHQSSYYWLQFLIALLVAILFAVDTGLLISTQQQFTVLLKIMRTRKSNKLIGPHPTPDPKND